MENNSVLKIVSQNLWIRAVENDGNLQNYERRSAFILLLAATHYNPVLGQDDQNQYGHSTVDLVVEV